MSSSITPADILLHPRFQQARATHIDALVALFRADRFVTSIMADAGVITMRGFLVSLHLAFDPDAPSTWATPSNLRQALVTRGLASPRRIDDLLARFRQHDYVETIPSPGDRRIHLLAPTAKLVAHDRDHLATYHRFLLDLYPGRGYEWALQKRGDAHRAFRRAGLRNQRQALSALGHPVARLFLARDAGYLALLLVLQAQLRADDGLSWSAMAQVLGVARSHLRRLFAEAETAGYVRLSDGRTRPVEILPALWSAFDEFLAGVQADQDAIAQAAWNSSA